MHKAIIKKFTTGRATKLHLYQDTNNTVKKVSSLSEFDTQDKYVCPFCSWASPAVSWDRHTIKHVIKRSLASFVPLAKAHEQYDPKWYLCERCNEVVSHEDMWVITEGIDKEYVKALSAMTQSMIGGNF